MLVGISFYSPHGTSWRHLPWHSQQQLESAKMNQLVALPSKPVESRKRRDNRKSQQFMSALKLVPHHPCHWTLAWMAKVLSFLSMHVCLCIFIHIFIYISDALLYSELVNKLKDFSLEDLQCRYQCCKTFCLRRWLTNSWLDFSAVLKPELTWMEHITMPQSLGRPWP